MSLRGCAPNPSRPKEGQIRTPVGGNSRIVFNKRASLVQSSEAFPSRVVKPAASRHSSMAGINFAKKEVLAFETDKATPGAGGRVKRGSRLFGEKDGSQERA